MSLLLFWQYITGAPTPPARDLGYKPRGIFNLIKSRGLANRNPAILIDDGTLMEDTIVTMESLTALMGGNTFGDRTPQGVVSSTKPKGGFQ